MNDKLHTVRLSVEVASFEKSDLPRVDKQLVEDVAAVCLGRCESVTVRVMTPGGQDISGDNPGRKAKGWHRRE